MAFQEHRSLKNSVLQLIADGATGPQDDNGFNEIALSLFRYQVEMNQPYRAFCSHRNIAPNIVSHWTEIPALPTSAFKEFDVACFDPSEAHTVFESSGTTGSKPSRHHISDLSLYEASLLAHFKLCILPDGKQLPMLLVSQPPSMAPRSSLVHMLETVRIELAAEGDYYIDNQGLRLDSIFESLRRQEEALQPVAILGTTLAFVHLLDACQERTLRFSLPQGSRLMDTGGYKGRSREVPKPELRRLYSSVLGIPPTHVVNEYGMTEMGSQFYDTSLLDHLGGIAREPRKRGAPWTRTTVVDPETMTQAAPGRTGLLRHYDLTNVDSVIALQTDDLGVQVDNGFEIVGRAAGAGARGCSISVDTLLSQARG